MITLRTTFHNSSGILHLTTLTSLAIKSIEQALEFSVCILIQGFCLHISEKNVIRMTRYMKILFYSIDHGLSQRGVFLSFGHPVSDLDTLTFLFL